MLQQDTMQFMADLAANNNREWFEDNRKRYETAKADFEAFGEDVRKHMLPFEPLLADTTIKQSTFRIYRDVRFSKDKSPYKTNLSMFLNPRGKDTLAGGYYLHLQPGGHSFIAGGAWMPQGSLLKNIRQEIDYNPANWRAITEAKDFAGYFTDIGGGNKLTRPPKGYEPDNEMIEFLKLKSYEASHAFADDVFTSEKATETIVDGFSRLKPLNEFLVAVLDNTPMEEIEDTRKH